MFFEQIQEMDQDNLIGQLQTLRKSVTALIGQIVSADLSNSQSVLNKAGSYISQSAGIIQQTSDLILNGEAGRSDDRDGQVKTSRTSITSYHIITLKI